MGPKRIDADALLALTALGSTKANARRVLVRAREDLDEDADLETVIRGALRYCR